MTDQQSQNPEFPFIQGMTPMLKVRDIQETIAFYRRIPGFVLRDSLSDEKGMPYWCLFSCGGGTLMFYSMDNPPGPPGMSGVLYCYPLNVEELWKQMKEGFTLAWPLQETSYGLKEFAIIDCNGYVLAFGQPTRQAE